MEISAVLIMAVIVEAVIDYVKGWVVQKKIQWQHIAGELFGVAVSFAYSLDIPALVGIESGIKYVGIVLTGVLISRGSNSVHDLYKTLISKKGVKSEERI